MSPGRWWDSATALREVVWHIVLLGAIAVRDMAEVETRMAARKMVLFAAIVLLRC
jgi:hypothetical protein